MIGRRRFFGVASLGLASALAGSRPLFARQDPRLKPKAGSKARSKGKSAANPALPVETDEQVNRILGQARTDGRRLPGMIGGIVRGEELTNVGAVGFRKVGSPEPIRVDDLMHLGSCTKAMTATMIGTLVDEGKLRWDSTVAEVFPGWAEQLHPAFASVTLDQLLRHRAGLSHDVDWWQADRSRPQPEQRRVLLSQALRAAPESTPGSKYSYSNTGYVLAGAMAEQVTQTPWEDLMRRRLFGPLGMASAGFGPPGTKGLVDHAWGHRASGDLVEAMHFDNPAVMGPAGTVHCSLVDWARFASYHLRGTLGGVRLLKSETLKALHTPRSGEEYVGGWIALDRSWAGGLALTHSGSNSLWYGTIWLAPARDFAMLVAINAAGKPAEDASEEAVKGLLRYSGIEDRPRRR